MDRFELVEKLVKSTGVGYEDAKTALESSGWDLLDAAVWLEKNGKVENRTQHFTTDPEQQQQAQEAAEQQQRNEAPRGSFSSKTDVRTNGVMHSIFAKIKGILTDNELVICKQSGEVFLELPIWLSVLLLIVAFWPTVGVLVLVFILGFRFRLWPAWPGSGRKCYQQYPQPGRKRGIRICGPGQRPVQRQPAVRRPGVPQR